jgi:tRNA(adenine34) deaminase
MRKTFPGDYPVDAYNRNVQHWLRMTVDLYHLMGEALSEAKTAFRAGEVPVGAVLTDREGGIIARAHNRSIALNDPTAHAEILVIRGASAARHNYRLTDTLLVVTVEPCPMCVGAAVHARITGLVFGTADPKWGAAGSLYNLAEDSRFNHCMEVTAGILEEECRDLMQAFFRRRRRPVQE